MGAWGQGWLQFGDELAIVVDPVAVEAARLQFDPTVADISNQ